MRGRIRRKADHYSITLFLVNGQEEPKRNRDQAWMFQPEMRAESADERAVFVRRPSKRGSTELEQQTMEMLYRKRLEFAVGHGVSVTWEVGERVDRAAWVSTRVAPELEVARVVAPTPEEDPRLAGLVTDMQVLAESSGPDLLGKLTPLASGYRAWIEEQNARRADAEFATHQDAAATNSVEQSRLTLARMEEGLRLIAEDPNAEEAFRFANRAMWQQRVRSLWTESRRRASDAPLDAFDIPKNRSWYPFQLAFLLLNLAGITKLDHEDRVGETSATCDLLWFPTGGGKTEAYLGLAAYTLALRRLQGRVAGRDGENGVAVLMRYTLRVLTLQQFQRAAALICACEVIRREWQAKGDRRLGETPFRIGLWVGEKTTPNKTEDSAESVARSRGNREFYAPGGRGSPHQLNNCPWCGTKIDPGKHIVVGK